MGENIPDRKNSPVHSHRTRNLQTQVSLISNSVPLNPVLCCYLCDKPLNAMPKPRERSGKGAGSDVFWKSSSKSMMDGRGDLEDISEIQSTDFVTSCIWGKSPHLSKPEFLSVKWAIGMCAIPLHCPPAGCPEEQRDPWG